MNCTMSISPYNYTPCNSTWTCLQSYDDNTKFGETFIMRIKIKILLQKAYPYCAQANAVFSFAFQSKYQMLTRFIYSRIVIFILTNIYPFPSQFDNDIDKPWSVNFQFYKRYLTLFCSDFLRSTHNLKKSSSWFTLQMFTDKQQIN